jgi:hypothetical protein
MVIQSNMSPNAIVDVWEITSNVFEKYKIPKSEEALESLIEETDLGNLLVELNNAVGSSTTTCIEGG